MKRIVTLRQTEILLWLLIFRISMDIFMILKNQKWLSIDEATIGTMAMDILQKGVHPLYFYGQTYNGGASIEAHFISLIMRLIGISPLAVKMCAIFLDSLIIAAFYFFIVDHWGKEKASWGILLYVLSTVTMAWNIQLPGGYQETILLDILMAHIFFSILNGNRQWSSFALLGFLTGMALYILELSIPFILSYLVFLVFYKRNIFVSRNMIWFVLFFVIGYSPALYYNFFHNFQNWHYIISGGSGLSSLTVAIKSVPIIFGWVFGIWTIAKFFEPYNEKLYLFDTSISFGSWVQLCIFSGTLIFTLWSKRKALQAFIANILGKQNKVAFGDAKTIFVLLFIVAQICATLSRLNGFRYLLPMFPFLIICAVDFLDTTMLPKRIFYITACFLILNGLYTYAHLLPVERKCGQEVIDIAPKFHFQPYEEKCGAIMDVVKFLEKLNIRIAVAPNHDTLITLYSKGKVIGIGPRYPTLYSIRGDEEHLRNAAVVVYRGSAGEREVLLALKDMKNVKVAIFDTLRVYYPINLATLVRR